MANEVSVKGSLGGIPIQLQVSVPGAPWWTPYTPALPGIGVAFAGLFIAHRLTLRRERRKEIRDLCDSFHDLALDVADAAAEAWAAPPGDDRSVKIQAAKAKLQTLGVKATAIRRQSARRVVRLGGRPVRRSTEAIDLIRDIARLRGEITNDPFEDPARDAALDAAENARAEVAVVQAELYRRLADYFRLPA